MGAIQKNTFSNLKVDSSAWQIDIFDQGTGKKEIHVEKEGKLDYLCVCTDTADIDLHVYVGEQATVNISVLCVGTGSTDAKVICHSHLNHNKGTANMHILSLLRDGSSCTIDGGVIIHPDVEDVSGHLLEEIIALDPKVKIKTLPRLDVHSNQVSASHGARIEKLSPKKLFYLCSKGLSHQQAKELMIAGYVKALFEPFREKDEQHIDQMTQKYLTDLVH